MRLLGRWRARLLRSPVYLLLSAPSAANSDSAGTSGLGTAHFSSSLQRRFAVGKRPQQGGQRLSAFPGDAASGGVGGGARAWLWLLRRRLAVTCRPRNLAKLFGAILVALMLVIIVTKSYSMRRRGTCKCAKFTFSQCQPYDGICGQGVKKAFCQQKSCMPRRKMVRCLASCDRADGSSDAMPMRTASVCSYSVRRQSRWTKCSEGARHKSRILFLQSAGSQAANNCPPTRKERRPCKAKQQGPSKSCSYEPRGMWTACNRERNEIVNTRRLTDGGTGGHCPMELRTAMRCLRRDGSLRCIYSKWTKWSQCHDGIRHKTRTLVQGIGCGEVTRLTQNCSSRRTGATKIIKKK